MNRKQTLAAAAIVLALGAAWMWGGVFGQSQPNVQVPKFQYDPTFPQPLPEKWAIGAIGGMAVDSHDHIWVLHRPAPLQKNERFAGAAMTPPRAECCIPAPPVLERSEEHTSELQSQSNLVCRLLLEKKKNDVSKTPTVTPVPLSVTQTRFRVTQ